MQEVFDRMIIANDLSCVDRFDIPERPQRLATIPQQFRSGAPSRWLMNNQNIKGKLWLHQANAMKAAAHGNNVIISTGTASGKSLIFQSVALRILDTADDASVIVFYPLKALANDQFMSWCNAVEMAGLSRSLVDKIDGTVPRHERAQKLRSARIVLMTPDVCHAWLMQEISNPDHQDFISKVALIVIDESHVLEGVFGSNFAYLFRRLSAVRHHILHKKNVLLCKLSPQVRPYVILKNISITLPECSTLRSTIPMMDHHAGNKLLSIYRQQNMVPYYADW